MTFEENTKGSIEAGKLADLVVLIKDMLTCAEKNIETPHVAMTVAIGKSLTVGTNYPESRF